MDENHDKPHDKATEPPKRGWRPGWPTYFLLAVLAYLAMSCLASYYVSLKLH